MHEEISLPMTTCASCNDTTLVYADMVSGEVVHRCIHCHAIAEHVEWLEPWAVVQFGYRVDGVSDPNAKRGCRGGACGVHQPEN